MRCKNQATLANNSRLCQRTALSLSLSTRKKTTSPSRNADALNHPKKIPQLRYKTISIIRVYATPLLLCQREND